MKKALRSLMYPVLAAVLGVAAINGCASLWVGKPKTPAAVATIPPPPDTTAPKMIAFHPAESATGVAVNSTVIASFSEPMAASGFDADGFVVLVGISPVAGTVRYLEQNRTAVFVPTRTLANDTTYTVKISTGAKDLAGNPLPANTGWNFTTGSEMDSTAPAVVSTFPVNSASGVPSDSLISATFSEAMDPATMNASNFLLVAGNATVPGSVYFDLAGKKIVFTPAGKLAEGIPHTAAISNGGADVGGNALASRLEWVFTPGPSADSVAPTVVSTFPVASERNVGINSTLTATFSEAMDSASISAAHFALSAGMTPVAGSITYDLPNRTAIFAPVKTLAFGTLYTARITNGAKDLASNALVANKEWTFTTAPAGQGPAPVMLGTAGNFVVLAKKAISTVPSSSITGDIGLSPAGDDSLTGFSQMASTGYSTAPQVTGFIYSAAMAPPTRTNMAKVIADMDASYADAAGRTKPDFLNHAAGNIGGLLLAPGLYKWETGVAVASNLTLSGGPGDVWILQIGGDLTLSKAVEVSLSGGALAKNVFWQVVGKTSLGTGSRFEGIILGKDSIAVGTRAAMNGRALSQTQVSLDQASITKPAP